jgi:hypothetical protein
MGTSELSVERTILASHHLVHDRHTVVASSAQSTRPSRAGAIARRIADFPAPLAPVTRKNMTRPIGSSM